MGWLGITFLLSAFFQFITIAQIKQLLGTKRMMKTIDKMTDHFIICGYRRIGQMLADKLTAGGTDFVIL